MAPKSKKKIGNLKNLINEHNDRLKKADPKDAPLLFKEYSFLFAAMLDKKDWEAARKYLKRIDSLKDLPWEMKHTARLYDKILDKAEKGGGKELSGVIQKMKENRGDGRKPWRRKGGPPPRRRNFNRDERGRMEDDTE